MQKNFHGMDVNKPSHQLHELYQSKVREISNAAACLFKGECIRGESIKLNLQMAII